jgi:hypothetical protein
MVRKLIIGVVLTVALSVAAGSAYAGGVLADEPLAFGLDGAPGLFCEVEKSDVCVMARTEEDCTKLGGVKADTCEAPESEGE